MKAMTLADGFEINLFAADPLITKPIQMNFDPAGRLWIACSETYPQLQPGTKARDTVLILEDDGTGKAKSVKVFADGLLIPTGVAPGDGGAYVANSTELVHYELKDGKAVNRKVVLSGFGTEDTHHILHTLRWGPDSRLYFNQSIYIHSHIETPWGVRRLAGGGVWRFHTPSQRLEVFVKGLVNSWGHVWDDFGQQFGTDGAGGEGINYYFPGAIFVTSPGAERIMQGLNPGSPKYAGEEVMSGRHLPDDWQGNILTNDFRASRVCRFQITDDNSGFASKQLPDLIKSSNRVFRPIDVKMGPDGAIYIADWCNPIINHGEVDFRDARRDHTHGRIWRVTAKGRPLVAKHNLVDATVPELLEFLKSPEMYTRMQAKRVLSEKGAAVVAGPLSQWVAQTASMKPHPQISQYLLEALWTFESIDTLEPTLLMQLIASGDPRVRAAAVRTVSHWHEQLPNAQDILAKTINDDHPRVRLESIRALAEIPSAKSMQLALSVLNKPRDKNIDYALWMTTRDLQPQWKPALDSGQLKFSDAEMVYVMQSIGSREALKPLLEQLKANKMSADDRKNLLDLIAKSGGATDLGPVFDLAVSDELSNSNKIDVLRALTEAAATRKVIPNSDHNALHRLFTGDPAVAAQALQLAGYTKAGQLRGEILRIAKSPDGNLTVRQAAIESVATFMGKTAPDQLAGLCDAKQPQVIRFTAAAAMARMNGPVAAGHAVAALSGANEADPTPLFKAFLKSPSGDAQLANAMKGKKINPDSAKIGLRTVYESSRLDSPLIAALNKAGELGTPAPELTKDQMAALITEVANTGDPIRGEAVFRRKEMACLQCHAIAGSGGIVAPDMLSIGASAPVDYIIDSLLLPNKAVKEGYNSTIVTLRNGDQISGIRVRQSNFELVLKDAVTDAIVIPLNQIKSQREGGSIMPTGLTDSLTHRELVDLVRFLSELGKGKYASAGVPVARRWRLLDPPMGDGSSITPELLDANASLKWVPVYAQVDGVMPKESFASPMTKAVLRTQIEATTGGIAKLKLNETSGMQVWLDNDQLPLTTEIELNLKKGTHTLTFLLSNKNRQEGLRCELVDVAGSTAKAQFVAGK